MPLSVSRSSSSRVAVVMAPVLVVSGRLIGTATARAEMERIVCPERMGFMITLRAKRQIRVIGMSRDQSSTSRRLKSARRKPSRYSAAK